MEILKQTLKNFLKTLYFIFLIPLALYLTLAIFIIPFCFIHWGVPIGILSILIAILILCFFDAIDKVEGKTHSKSKIEQIKLPKKEDL